MAQGKRNRLSTEQRIDMWRRWKAGESLHDIGRAFGKGHGSIRFGALVVGKDVGSAFVLPFTLRDIKTTALDKMSSQASAKQVVFQSLPGERRI
jgi:hypothetical protein